MGGDVIFSGVSKVEQGGSKEVNRRFFKIEKEGGGKGETRE